MPRALTLVQSKGGHSRRAAADMAMISAIIAINEATGRRNAPQTLAIQI